MGSTFAYGEHVLTKVGIGGVYGAALVQIGTLYTPNAINGHAAGWYPWYEFTGHGGISIDTTINLAAER